MILEMVEGFLKLTPEEKPVVEAAMPIVARWITLLNGDFDTLLAAYHLLVKAQPVVVRLFTDLKLLAPVAAAVLENSAGFMESMGAMQPAHDVQETINANPYLVNSFKSYGSKLGPLINEIKADWPKVAPAWAIIAPKLGIH